MEPQPSASPDSPGPGSVRYTVSQTARACLHALHLAAWIEAMVLAHRAVQPHGPGAWSWLIVRCLLLMIGVHLVVARATQIARWRAVKLRGTPAPAGTAAEAVFDAQAFESAASALLFHFGAPLWMWIFV